MNHSHFFIQMLTGLAIAASSSIALGAAEPPANRPPAATNSVPEHVHALPTNAIAAAKSEGFSFVSFDTLAGFGAELKVTATGPELTGKIPDEVLALSGKPVAIAGFMLPQKTRNGRVTEFLLLKETSKCCQGGPPRMNEWVIVRMKGGGVEAVTDRLLVVAGDLTVGEYRENGKLRAIYRMEAARIFRPDDDKAAR